MSHIVGEGRKFWLSLCVLVFRAHQRYPIGGDGFHWESYCSSGYFEKEQRAISQLLFNLSTLVIGKTQDPSLSVIHTQY